MMQSHLAEFQSQGFTIVRGLFSAEEVARYIDHYMNLRSSGSYPGDYEGVDPTSTDPLKKFPRMIHMHRWDDLSLQWLIDARLNRVLTELSEGIEPYAVQTMLYFKPAGARGQALHQDQFYLRAMPGTCLAAWLALDDCDESNGCLELVPGSHQWPLLCTTHADTKQSFTDVTVPLPEGTPIVPAIMKAGDVLFFHGQTVHGSKPNLTTDRFRRSLIGHYITGDARTVGGFYSPVYRMNGQILDFETSPDLMPCGVWVDNEIVIEERAMPALHE